MILFDHLRRCGGQTVCHHLKKLHPNHFQLDPANPNRSIRQFAEMPEAERHSFALVCGQNAITLRNWAHPSLVPMAVIREPVARVLSLYRDVRTNRQDRAHLLAKAYSVRWCVENVAGFAGYYAKHFRPAKYRFVFTSPESLLRVCGFHGEIGRAGESKPFEFDAGEVDAVRAANAQDIEIWDRISAAAKLGMASVRGI